MLAIIVGIVLITIGIFVWNQNKFPKNQEQEQPLVAQPQEGSLAPDFILSNLQGERVQLANLKGRPVLLISGLPGVLLVGKKCLSWKRFIENEEKSWKC